MQSFLLLYTVFQKNYEYCKLIYLFLIEKYELHSRILYNTIKTKWVHFERDGVTPGNVRHILFTLPLGRSHGAYINCHALSLNVPVTCSGPG